MAAEISYYHHEEVNQRNEIYQYFKQDNMNFQNKLNNGGAKNPTMDLAMVHVS